MSKPDRNNTPRPTPSPRRRWFAKGELTCVAVGCGKPMPEGYYGKQKSVYICSGTCSHAYYIGKRKSVRCTFCRKWFKRNHRQKTRPFCSMEHYYEWRRKQTDEIKCGRFAPILHEFIEDCSHHFRSKRSLSSTRCNLAAFFEFLRRKRMRSLEKVTPKTITAFFADQHKRGNKPSGRFTGNLKRFFDWLIVNGKRKSGNPVISTFHSPRRAKRVPRPYEQDELELIRKLLDESGDTVLQLAVAIGEECGLRIGEVCNLHLEDVDIAKQQIFVRLPNKSNRERWTPFHNRVKKTLIAWLEERPPVEHDFLLTGWKGIPLRLWTLRHRLNRLLCGPGKLKKFSFHRLRHTASSRVYPHMDPLHMMKTFGWESEKTMEGYTRVLPSTIRHSYLQAMEKVELDQAAGVGRSESLEDYFANQQSLNAAN